MKDLLWRIARLFIVLVVVGLWSLPRQVTAQLTGITWHTGVQVQNLSQTAPTTITLTFYDSTGAVYATLPADGQPPETIAAGASKTYNTVLDTMLGSSFTGSASISADLPIATIFNILGNGTSYSGSVQGVPGESASAIVSLPLVQSTGSGIETWFTVQNAGSVATTVKVSFIHGSFGTDYSFTDTIPANAAKTYQTTDYQAATGASLGGRFTGSATVESTNGQPLAVVVNQVGLGSVKVQNSYAGFGSMAASTNVSLPLIQNGNGNVSNPNQTGIAIKNTGATTTTVNMSFTPNTAKSGGVPVAFAPPAVAQITLGPGAATTYLTGRSTTVTTTMTGFGANDVAHRYVGSAIITSTLPIVVVVNQQSMTTGSSYEGFRSGASSTGSTTVSAPLLVSNNSSNKLYTGFQCQNVGNVPTKIKVVYGANAASGATFVPPTSAAATEAEVPAGGSFRRLQNVVADGWPASTSTDRYVGSGVFTSTPATGQTVAQPIICVINYTSDLASGDALMTYDGINF